MNALINAAFDRHRTALLLLIFLLLAGLSAYQNIPKESAPDVAIPLVYVSIGHEGISPEDAERLLIRPMEKALRNLMGLKEITATAVEGHGSITLKFEAGFDNDQALRLVRQKVDDAKAELPPDADEPKVEEVNVALFPVLTISLSGALDAPRLQGLAVDLRDRLEALPGVLEAEIAGKREAQMEIVVDPLVMESYGISFNEIYALISRNNLLVAAGAIDTGSGRMMVKAPGVIQALEDMLSMPVKVVGNRVVQFSDVAAVRRSFKDPNGFARVDGRPSLTLEVKKRIGANILETIAAVRSATEEIRKRWPEGVTITYANDAGREIKTMLSDLESNVASAIVLVMIIIIGALGARSSLLVGLAIPGSFLSAILTLSLMGVTLNMVVLFSLILVVGMLVDGAIVVIELADRYLQEGKGGRESFSQAAKRMAWPVIASTVTTLVVFMPLLFWPGVVGQFMKYLPLTVLVALTASLFMALVFMPVLGGLMSPRQPKKVRIKQESDVLSRGYVRLLERLLRHPGKTALAALMILIGTYATYGKLGKGVEFFPEAEPAFAKIQIHARGDLSALERDHVVREVESRLLGMPELAMVYARSFVQASGQQAEDVIGSVQLEFTDWWLRRSAAAILEDIRGRTADIPGVVVEIRKQESGPSGGKPIQLELFSWRADQLIPAVGRVRKVMEALGGFVDVEDSRPLPGVEWRLEVDRREAARFGVDVASLGGAVQLLTNGIRVGAYRPDDTDEEVEIRVRYPETDRHLDQLGQLRIPSAQGLIPVGNFVRMEPAQKTGALKRSAGRRVMTIAADVAEGRLADERVKKLRTALAALELGEGVEVAFKGEDEDQRETMAFLGNAFAIALFLMVLVLVTQFNSLYQAALVMSGIVLSTAGVLIGLMVSGEPFGVVMCGIGVIALAGIVVNNNIVLIDSYNEQLKVGLQPVAAALKTGSLRLRPVLLTTVTTVLGLMPMVLALNVDIIGRQVLVGAPSTQWWIQLSTAIAGGLTFASVMTLFLTPCLLVGGARFSGWITRRRQKMH
ncbi:MAG: efflux RND transporter permease subunit [Magnetococcales bacterium]|nr:efflux RND transporter permease subunit [Magnetococcales bacterium]